jgi:predicted PurR-regulated permease PerM
MLASGSTAVATHPAKARIPEAVGSALAIAALIVALTGLSLIYQPVAIASFIQFENVGYACLAPLLYLALNSLESNFVTPNILGRWMTLNPVGIFLSFLFWGWLWGVPGMLLAVPILAIIKIFCDRVDSLTPAWGIFGRLT